VGKDLGLGLGASAALSTVSLGLFAAVFASMFTAMGASTIAIAELAGLWGPSADGAVPRTPREDRATIPDTQSKPRSSGTTHPSTMPIPISIAGCRDMMHRSTLLHSNLHW
jgi:hypothetical protein